MTQVLISMGSNKSNPQFQIQRAFQSINERFQGAQISSMYLTEPVGGIPQDPFVNAAIGLETSGTAYDLLRFLLTIEQDALRDRTLEIPNGPRTMDLDIILFGQEIIKDSELKVPHPRFRERRFVLEPLQEIAPTAIDPLSRKSITQLLNECTDVSWVKPLDEEAVF